ncbi:MAG: hypothetical protein HQ582_30840 [Planctomycetes bacterium]|nr:hypothetical protein [Planctomycetota bacterium]
MPRDNARAYRTPRELGIARRVGLPTVHLLLVWLAASTAWAGAAPETRPPRAKLPIPIKILRYSQRLVDKYDRNGDGRLDQDEWSQMQGNPRLADSDRDGLLTAAELAERVARYGRPRKIRLTVDLAEGDVALRSFLSPANTRANQKGSDRSKQPPSQAGVAAGKNGTTGLKSAKNNSSQKKRFASRTRLPRTLPSWFRLRDADGDAQITMAEFASEANQTQFDEFARYDHNGDGVITAEECERGPKRTGKSAPKPVVQPAAEQAVKEPPEAVLDEPDPEEGEEESAAEKAAALKAKRLEKLRARKQKHSSKPPK